ncbi:hypothetical protein KY290_031291 [Solanum tuberosum]|uniref:GAG-pre-integrase domain-containing protein n=1 Tax=Solanum tuberosum TaxID=4113 RepID=A0ABQ7UAK7_SOLTU|nr:hypothetical protein KY290_031291 [Solanum tuberosum]
MWKAQFSMLMHGHDLYGHLDGSAPSPSRTITTGTVPSANPAFSLWFHQDQLIQNAINLFIQQLPPLLQLLIHQKRPGMHCTQPMRIIGAPITNSELIVEILSSLGPEFREISAVICARDSIISYEELYEKLLDHDLFLRHEESKHTPNQITAAAATSKRSGHSNSRNTRRPNNGGPTIALLHPISVDLPPPPSLMMVFAANCATNQAPTNSWIVDYGASHHITAEPHNLQAPTNSWIVDYGASHHITAEPHNLQAYNGMEHVSMGDDLNTGTPLVHGQSTNGLYERPTSPSVPSPQAHAASSNSSSIITWHRRLGHPHARLLHTPLNEFLLPNDDIDILLKRQEHYYMKPHFP